MSSNSNQPMKNNINVLSTVVVLVLFGLTLTLIYFVVQYTREPFQSKIGFFEYLLNPKQSICMSGTENSNDPNSQQLPQQQEIDANAMADYNSRESQNKDEVWHINDQLYTYDEAKEKCKAYGSRLANKAEVINAYNNGAQWTNYGWTHGREAYYPIQPCEYMKLRRDGVRVRHPGLNGGSFNRHIRFGANCYGVKPPGEIITEPKDPVCTQSNVCQDNPDACDVSKNDSISPFNKKWSAWE